MPFTGAGISTECGIPDFRSPGGLWTKNQPIPFDAFLASREMRDEAWRRRFVMEDNFAKAKPGRGHLALASLYRAGKVPALVTQNIDNLHQASGIAADDVVELHGNTTYALCLECDERYELAWVRQELRGRRRARAGLRLRRLHQDRHRFVRAGDAGRRDAARRAIDAAIAICFSPSARRWWCGRRRDFRCMAKRNGAALVIINREPTEFDELADLVVHHDIGDVLGPFIAH